jgi:hypothetical protein
MLLTPRYGGRSEWGRMADYTWEKAYRGVYLLTFFDGLVNPKDSQDLRDVEKQR